MIKSDNRCEEDVLEMEKRWRALPKFVSINFNDVDHTDDPSNDTVISDDQKRLRALPKFVSIDFNDGDRTDDPSNDAAISDADDDEKRWRALLGLVTDD